MTPCDAKVSSKEQADLTAKQDITLYIGLDGRVTTAPAWLDGFELSRSAVTTSNDVTFNLYTKTLKAGESVTLGANGQSASCMNYIVIASDAKLPIRGDVNADGKFDIADVVLLQKWLLAVPDTQLADWQTGDLCEDGKLNVFDLALMKRDLIENLNN